MATIDHQLDGDGERVAMIDPDTGIVIDDNNNNDSDEEEETTMPKKATTKAEMLEFLHTCPEVFLEDLYDKTTTTTLPHRNLPQLSQLQTFLHHRERSWTVKQCKQDFTMAATVATRSYASVIRSSPKKMRKESTGKENTANEDKKTNNIENHISDPDLELKRIYVSGR